MTCLIAKIQNASLLLDIQNIAILHGNDPCYHHYFILFIKVN